MKNCAESHYLIDGMYVVKLNGVQLGGLFTSATADETVRVINSEIEAIVAPLQAELTALRKLEAEIRDLRESVEQYSVPEYGHTGFGHKFLLGSEVRYSFDSDYLGAIDDALALVDSVRTNE